MKVFVSYSHEDRDYAVKAQETLSKRGFDVWTDVDADSTKTWDEQVLDKLKTSDAVLFILSPNSLKSTNFKDLMNLAIRYKKFVIPILLKDVKENPFSQTEYIDVSEGQTLPESLFQRLESVGVNSRLAGDSTTDAPPPDVKKKKRK